MRRRRRRSRLAGRAVGQSQGGEAAFPGLVFPSIPARPQEFHRTAGSLCRYVQGLCGEGRGAGRGPGGPPGCVCAVWRCPGPFSSPSPRRSCVPGAAPRSASPPEASGQVWGEQQGWGAGAGLGGCVCPGRGAQTPPGRGSSPGEALAAPCVQAEGRGERGFLGFSLQRAWLRQSQLFSAAFGGGLALTHCLRRCLALGKGSFGCCVVSWGAQITTGDLFFFPSNVPITLWDIQGSALSVLGVHPAVFGVLFAICS